MKNVRYNSGMASIDGASSKMKDEVAKMPCYPDDGSIKVIDEYVVVKLGDSPELGKE